MTKVRTAFLMFSALFFLAGVSGCGSSDGEKATPVPANTIVIKSFAYSPATLQAKVGDTITVKNEDDADHTVTAKDKSFDTGPLKKGQSATIKVTKAGRNDYICTIHPYMTGVIQAA